MFKRTKIICTIGPASSSVSVLRKMIRAGMNVARLNFSHGTHLEHSLLIERIRQASGKLKKHVGIIQDLQGPRIRLGILPTKGVMLKKGGSYVFTTDNEFDGRFNETKKIYVTYSELHKDIKKNEAMLIRDGLIRLKVLRVVGCDIHAKVEVGGLVASHKGLNFPDTRLSIDPITQKDFDDLRFGVEAGVNFVALSFVGSSAHVHSLRKQIERIKKQSGITREIGIISKIEKPEAIENIEEIIEASEAIMIARGDLGVELAAYDVPVWQKRIIAMCRKVAKPVIVATQMLESMIENPSPTRAEVSDVANAVIDHADAVMLSGETAQGKFPVAAVEIMNRTIMQVEASPFDDVIFTPERYHLLSDNANIAGLLSATCARAGMIGVIALFGGDEAFVRAISSFRSEVLCLVVCDTVSEAESNTLHWGIESFVSTGMDFFDDRKVKKFLRERGACKKGERILVIRVTCDERHDESGMAILKI